MGPKKTSTPFQSSHALQYGMELIRTEGNVEQTCRCLFCVHEGRDVVEVGDDSGRKRARRTDTKYCTEPFLPHKYRSHLDGQHNESWTRYQTLSAEDKKSYFNGMAKHTNTLHDHVDLSTEAIEYVIQNSIVETMIGDLFFRDDDEDSGEDSDGEGAAAAIVRKVAKKVKEKVNAMKMFVKKEDVVTGTHTYTATIKNAMRFELAMDHVSVGMSFRQAAAATEHAKARTKTPKLQGMTDLIVAQSVRVLVAVALQTIARIIDDPSVWAISLAGDGSTHRGQSFFDLRIRVCYRGFLVNLHLVAIPMFDRHTAQNIFQMIVKFLDALYAKWRAKLIGFSSDGENTMTGRHGGLVTLIVKEAENDVVRIWCPPHQIDIVVKISAEGIYGGSWVKDAAPVMPAQLVKMRPGVFCKDVLAVRREHVTKFWSAEKVDMVEEEHRELIKLYNTDPIIRAAIYKHSITTTFNDAWDVLPSGFDNLRAFSGGLATVLANTTSVESDFSVLKWELDEFRSSLMHLSLEGIFQTKQRRLLLSLLGQEV